MTTRGNRRARPGSRRKRSDERGIALVLVLGALTVLTVMLTDFQDETSAELGSALSARDQIQAEYAARSGVNLARLFIATEPTIRKSIGLILSAVTGGGSAPQIPIWEFADQVLGAFNDQEGTDKFAALAGVKTADGKNLGLPGAGFDIQIVDEDAKINLNLASREIFSQGALAQELTGLISSPEFDPLFSGRDGDEQFTDRQTVCGALIDWVDSNQEASACDVGSGAAQNVAPEDSFYQLLDKPYPRKNAPFDSLEELHRVRGVSDDFWSNFVDPHPDDPKQRNVTVWGQGRININTANAQTILALICGGGTDPVAKVCTDPIEAAKFLALVTMLRDLTAGVPILGSPKQLIKTLKQEGMLGEVFKSLGMEPIVFKSPQLAEKFMSSESKVFSLYVTGRVKAGQRRSLQKIHAVVDFRGAPPPPSVAAKLAASGALGALAAANPASSASAADPSAPAPDQNALSMLLTPSPGGRIVYFRIE